MGEMVTDLTNQIPYTKRRESQMAGFSLKWGQPKKLEIRLIEEILPHLGCIKLCK